MKIALLGYGKMGQVMNNVERGHEIILKKDENNT
jgi:3-hydroxyisobutyrate dehydrogenase-like beta-hydroxyacid dehydrogenase